MENTTQKPEELMEGLLNGIREKFQESKISIANATTLIDLLFEDPKHLGSQIYEVIILSIIGRNNDQYSDVLIHRDDIMKIDELFTVARALNELDG